MAERLKKLLPKLISENQNGFTPDKEIADSIILVSEVIHLICKEKQKEWIESIKFCISTVNYSLIVNGNVRGFFGATNGLCQGDPLSPALFELMAEVLGKLIKKRHTYNIWKGIKVHNQLNAITHSQFADDIVIFGEASLVEAKNIMSTLKLYSEQFGQLMNNQKLQLFFFNTDRQTQLRIASLFGIIVSELPIKYLGIRIDKGGRQPQIWDDVIKSCMSKSEIWKNIWLT
ncbi:uncharacterized protein LOC131860395 [Cryptomeria japonica]|uniref:uncharacterized protein LOC131860395 n=1 Tax=Cryptomeria japonica TaxID=3369 RepID=UPI0027DA7B40|nr:uncharacterized protein LOC131860395 [Cryptomeria japonica]